MYQETDDKTAWCKALESTRASELQFADSSHVVPALPGFCLIWLLPYLSFRLLLPLPLNRFVLVQENVDDTPTVDISDELVYLRECQQAFTLTQDVLQQIVIRANGNLPLSLSIMQSSSRILHASTVHHPKHSRGLWVDGKEFYSSLQMIAPNSIFPISSQHLVHEDTAAPHLQTCRLQS